MDIRKYVYLCLDYRLPIEFPQFIGKIRQEILSRVIPRLADKIFPKEREELTRVRNTLAATVEISDDDIDQLLATYKALAGLSNQELDSYFCSLDAIKQSRAELDKTKKAIVPESSRVSGWRRALVWMIRGQ